MSNLGLQENELSFLKNTLAEQPSLWEVRIFGSRAKGTYTQKSDIDIAYSGELTHAEYSELSSKLTYDAPYLYATDVISYKQASKALQEHIDRVGVRI